MSRVPILPNSTSQFVKFHEVLRHYYPQIPYVLQQVGVVVLTDNTSKYKQFIVTSRFYCFINGKIKKEQENLELNTNVAKTGNFTFFRGKQQILRQTANSVAATCLIRLY